MSVWSKSGCGNRAGHPVRRSCTFFVPIATCQARVLECQAPEAKALEAGGWRVAPLAVERPCLEP